jgi:hypothetical protein
MVRTLGGVVEVKASEHTVELDPHVVATFPDAGVRCTPFVKTPASYAPHEHTQFLSNAIRFYLLDCHLKRRKL